MSRTISMNVSGVSSTKIDQVKAIVAKPATNPQEAAEQLRALAETVLELHKQCDGLASVLMTLANNAKFIPK